MNVSKLQIDVNGAFRHSGWVLKETVAHAHNNFNIMVDQTQKRQGVVLCKEQIYVTLVLTLQLTRHAAMPAQANAERGEGAHDCIKRGKD